MLRKVVQVGVNTKIKKMVRLSLFRISNQQYVNQFIMKNLLYKPLLISIIFLVNEGLLIFYLSNFTDTGEITKLENFVGY